MQNEAVYSHYTPLRNHLRQLYLSESLYVLWAYNQLLQYKTPLPPDIQGHRELTSSANHQYRFVSPWELEILIKETIINAHEKAGRKTLRKWDYFAGAMNKLKALDGFLADKYINPDNVFLELITRLSHREFPWQTLYPQREMLIRYYILFSEPVLDTIIHKKIGLSTEKLYLIGSIFLGAFLENPAKLLPLKTDIAGITQRDLDISLNYFSMDLASLKEKLVTEQEFNEKYNYSFNSLRTYPLIQMDYHYELSLVCPSPTLLFWRFTNGLYYEICSEKGFENGFGKAFQNYVGRVLSKTLKNCSYYPEQEYHVGNNRKDSIDWIIDGDSLLFIECKTRRMAYTGKLELLSEDAINKEVEKMSDIVFQAYKTIEDFKKGYYVQYNLNITKEIFPLIITLEDWYFFGDILFNKLNENLVKKFIINNLPLAWLETMPYSICSIDEFETMIQIIEQVGVSKFIGNKVNNKEKKIYAYASYTYSDYPEERENLKSLFDKEWEELFVNYK